MKNKDMKINTTEKTGYVVYNPTSQYYYDEDIYDDRDIGKAHVFDTICEARDAIEEYADYPSQLEIHKVKFIFNVEEILKRKVTYETVLEEEMTSE
jgi:hypothetical protein